MTSPSAHDVSEVPRPVKPAPFRYADPDTLEEALAVLSDEGAGAKVLAGGQSLLPLLSMRLAAPTTLVDINRVPGLDSVEVTEDGVTVGALVRHNALLGDDDAARVQPLLARATANVAHPAIRNRGTTVGSIAHADPSGEMTSVLALTDGSVTVATPSGAADRRVARPVRRPAGDLDLRSRRRHLRLLPGAARAVGDGLRRGRPPQGRLRGLRRRRRRHAGRRPPGRARPRLLRLGGHTPEVHDLTEAVAGEPVDSADWAAAGALARTWSTRTPTSTPAPTTGACWSAS